ncbi:phage Gp19/Gp15/Gp42 family protein [Actinomyces bowdenii]|uniref:phage Gp19/Gp15/Gp42 family protein n=1 Tax=Actinomyces bowdenii TaxID=131109 RepID=UPI00214B8851|nr:phage Gp19/Gp15/Gp42 family protein [Actinomyces bowdenii]
MEDLEARWRGLSDQERQRAQVLLEDASDLIRVEAPRWQNASETTRKRITCAIVQRAMAANPISGEHEVAPRGVVAQEMHTTGPFTDSYTYRNPEGDLFLKRSEIRALGGRSGGAFSVDLYTGEVIGHG